MSKKNRAESAMSLEEAPPIFSPNRPSRGARLAKRLRGIAAGFQCASKMALPQIRRFWPTAAMAIGLVLLLDLTVEYYFYAGTDVRFVTPGQWWLSLRPEETAAWLQAIGSVAAIGIAIWIPHHELALRKAEEERRNRRVVADVATELYWVLSRWSSDWIAAALLADIEIDKPDELAVNATISDREREVMMLARDKHLHFDEATGDAVCVAVSAVLHFESTVKFDALEWAKLEARRCENDDDAYIKNRCNRQRVRTLAAFRLFGGRTYDCVRDAQQLIEKYRRTAKG